MFTLGDIYYLYAKYIQLEIIILLSIDEIQFSDENNPFIYIINKNNNKINEYQHISDINYLYMFIFKY